MLLVLIGRSLFLQFSVMPSGAPVADDAPLTAAKKLAAAAVARL